MSIREKKSKGGRKMKKVLVTLFLGVLLSVFSIAGLFAYDVGKINKVKKMVNEAVEYLKNGGDVNVFNDKNNTKWVNPPYYVFVYDCKDNSVILRAHPYLFNKLVGKPVAFIKDKKGKFLCLSLCRKVKESPNGVWDNYYWLIPKTNQLEEKFTYIKQVPGKPYQVAVGVYKSEIGSDITLDILNSKFK